MKSYIPLMLFQCVSSVPIVSFGSAMIAPIMRGIMSRMTPPDKQGKSQEFFLQIDCICETGQLVNIHITCIYTGN